MKERTIFRQLLLAGLLAVSLGAVAEPRQVVENLHAELLAAMQQADQLGFSGRSEKLAPVVGASFDFPTIARIVSGAAWKQASEAQKTAFIDVFRQLSIATYASNFSGYSGEQFVTAGTEKSRGGMIVRTHIVKSDGEQIPLNYMLRESDGRWLIVNVIAQGVSDLSLKRAEYSNVIKTEGYDSLTRRLQEKVKQFNR